VNKPRAAADTGSSPFGGDERMAQKTSSIDKGYWIFLLPGIALFVFLIVVPFFVNIGVSFTRWTGVGTPEWIGFTNYTRAFADRNFWASFSNNISVVLGMTIIPTLVGLFLATILFDLIAKRFGQFVASIFRAGFYLPQIIPVVVAAIVWRWILQPDWGVFNTVLTQIGLPHLTRNWLGDAATALPSVIVTLIWFQIGYPLVIFMAGLQRIDPELYEAAQIDGATWMQRFWRITIPLLRPEIYVVVLTTTIHALKTFGPVYAMTRGGPGNATIVASYFAYKNFFENANVGYGAAVSTVLTVIIIVITVIYIRVQTQQEQRESP
jgi:raffinose/stachyose/melibiose transport system permease protein